jgi:radical SAM superfamily enzyme YgiQ (UPF0313 family)
MRLTPRYKVKPVEKVIAEVRQIKQIWPHPFIELADDNSFANRRHAKALLRALAGEGIRWFTETDVSVADDPELLDLLHDSGCAEVLIGFESPTASGLDGIELRRNWKRDRLDGYREAIARIQGHGVAVNGCFVLGLDGDGPEVFPAVDAFVQETGLFDVQLTALTPFPGTELYDRLLREGRLLAPAAWERCSLFDVNFRPARMSAEALQRDLVELGRCVYTDERRAARRQAFKRHRRRFLREARKGRVLQ